MRTASSASDGQGLKESAQQRKESRLRLNKGSCTDLRPERPNHPLETGGRELAGVAGNDVTELQSHAHASGSVMPSA